MEELRPLLLQQGINPDWFSDKSLNVLSRSLEIAGDEFKCFGCGTEFLLLALLEDKEAIPFRALYELFVTPRRAHYQIERIVGIREENVHDIHFTPNMLAVFRLAWSEVLKFGATKIQPEHLLLGLARHEEGIANKVLLAFMNSPAEITRVVYRILDEAKAQMQAQPVRDRDQPGAVVLAPHQVIEVIIEAGLMAVQTISPRPDGSAVLHIHATPT
jgi:ATP-dependent Clp protease ATP-binding subunit ClpA